MKYKINFKVNTIEKLYKLSIDKKSVFCPNSRAFKKPRPAAFIINLQGRVLYNLFKSGMYVYNKK